MGTKNTKPERKTELSLDVHDNGGSTERLNGYLKGAGFEYIRGAGCYFTTGTRDEYHVTLTSIPHDFTDKKGLARELTRIMPLVSLFPHTEHQAVAISEVTCGEHGCYSVVHWPREDRWGIVKYVHGFLKVVASVGTVEEVVDIIVRDFRIPEEE